MPYALSVTTMRSIAQVVAETTSTARVDAPGVTAVNAAAVLAYASAPPGSSAEARLAAAKAAALAKAAEVRKDKPGVTPEPPTEPVHAPPPDVPLFGGVVPVPDKPG